MPGFTYIPTLSRSKIGDSFTISKNFENFYFLGFSNLGIEVGSRIKLRVYLKYINEKHEILYFNGERRLIMKIGNLPIKNEDLEHVLS